MRLALRAAADLVAEYPEGVWLVELGSIVSPAAVVRAVAAALRLGEDPHGPALATLTDYLRDRHILLVLDNCEHLVSECAALAEALLRTCPSVRILATSLEPLQVPGEMRLPVPSMALPAPGTPPGQMARYEAALLFMERARAASGSFAITPGNAPFLVEICTQLDGIPLAIELAAARVPLLSLPQIADRLRDRFSLLTTGPRTADLWPGGGLGGLLRRLDRAGGCAGPADPADRQVAGAGGGARRDEPLPAA